jgi:hypothetical protein
MDINFVPENVSQKENMYKKTCPKNVSQKETCLQNVSQKEKPCLWDTFTNVTLSCGAHACI